MIPGPHLLLDEKKCRKNIANMVKKADKSGVLLRPHFKTHQSPEIGKWFWEKGVSEITVSSMKMAEYFGEKQWRDITLAFPVNILEIQKINKLAKTVKLNLVVESVEVVEFLKANLKQPVRLLIKIDCGYGRTGILPKNRKKIDQLIKAMEGSDKIEFMGFLSHAGHSYSARSFEEIAHIHQESLKGMAELKEAYKRPYPYPELVISVGDTPTCSQMHDFGPATEIRPGNFVLYDLMQYHITSCELEEIAVAMVCPIVALHPEREEMIIHGGGVHFSKDVLDSPLYGKCYGYVVKPTKNGWTRLIEGVYLKKLSQEHGVVHAPLSFIKKQKIGNQLTILPVHSCMAVDLMRNYYTKSEKFIPIMP